MNKTISFPSEVMMRNMVMHATAIVAIAVMATSAQSMKFPQQKKYPNCIKPNLSQSSLDLQVKAAYDNYKTRFLKQAKSTSGGYYIESENTAGTWNVITVSEAHGWGMVIMTQMAGYDSQAKTIFDGMLKFYEDHKNSVLGSNLMGWQVFGDASKETKTFELTQQQKEYNSSATDGDLDIAYALLLAYKQWGDLAYKTKATQILQDIKSYNIHPSSKHVLLGNWASYTDSEAHSYTRPSDWMGGHFRTFAQATGDSYWDDVANTIYNVYNKFQANDYVKYGLVSDFIGYDGSTAWSATSNFLSSHGEKNPDKYYTNAARVPWRIASDYALSGNSASKAMLDKLNNFITTKISTPGNVKEGYWLSGDPLNDNAGGAAYLAPFVAASIAGSNTTFLTDGWNTLVSTTPYDAYQAAIKLQSMLLISGNWWHYSDASTGGDTDTFDTLGVYLDNFADSDLSQSKLATEYGKEKFPKAPWDAGGYWYSYGSAGAVKSASGTTIDTSNADEMFNASNSTLDVKLSKDGTVEATFPEEKAYNLSALTGITFRAKGTGKVRVTLVTPSNSVTGDDFYGGYGFNLDLTTSMKSYEIPVALLAAMEYSMEFKNQWNWSSHGAKSVEGFRITTVEDGDASLTVESIKLNGKDIKNETFGFTTPVIVDPIKGENVAKYGAWEVYADNLSKGTAKVIGDSVAVTFDRAAPSEVGKWDRYVSVVAGFSTESGTFSGLKSIEFSYTSDKDIAVTLPMYTDKGVAITGDDIPAHVVILEKGTHRVTKKIEEFVQPAYWLEKNTGLPLDLSKVTGFSLALETADDAATKGVLTINEVKFDGVTVKPLSIRMDGHTISTAGFGSIQATSGMIRANLSLPRTAEMNLSVVNMQGRIVASATQNMVAGTNLVSLGMSKQAKGVYFLVAQGSAGVYRHKFSLK